MLYPQIKLNKTGIKKYFQNSLWFTSKDIDNFEKLKTSIEPGGLVSIVSLENYFLGQGYFNPKSYYCLKLLTKENIPIDEKFFYAQFSKALSLRKKIYPNEKAFRLVFSEGDFLPGIIIDVFDKVIVVQLYTLGMEKLKNFIISALKNLLRPEVIVFKNDSSKRKEEGLELYTEVVEGNLKDPVLIEIDEIKFLIPIINGQKTGFFLDQRENRRFIRKLSQDMVVLDVFSYTGGFSFYALKGGAKRAFLIDRSELALNVAEEIAKINGWKDKIIIVKSDAFKVLKDPPESNLIILDPPAFIKSKKDIDLGIKKYEKLYFLGLKNLQKGLFFPFSCSYFLKMDTFWKMIIKELIKLRINGKIIYQGFQAFDHPINPNVEETFYLKGLGIWVE